MKMYQKINSNKQCVVCEFERLKNCFTVGRNRSGEMVKFGNINACVNFHEVVPPFPKV